jgi:MFS family permease
MVPSLILTIGILFCPFSPRWLISHDREDEARDILLKIRSASHDEIEEEMERIKNEVAYLRENEVDSYRQLLRAPLLRPFLLGVGIQILQQLTGINATMYYAPEIFNRTFLNTTTNTLDAALLATGVNGCVNVLATIPTLLFIDKLGRRILLIIGATIMSVSMLIVGILDATYLDQERSLLISWTIIVFIYIFVAGFAFGSFSAIGGFLFGYHTGVISGILTMQDFKETMNITKENSNTTDNARTQDAATSGIVGVLLFGCFLGSLISGQTSDRFSRKYSIAAFSLIFTISAALQTASPGIIMLLIGRLFAGK